MSLILDALKKLEQEKVRQERGQKLGAAIVAPVPRHSSRTPVIALVLAAVSVTAVATALIVKGIGNRTIDAVSTQQPLEKTSAGIVVSPLPEPTSASPATPLQPTAILKEVAPKQHTLPSPILPPISHSMNSPESPELNVSGIAWQDEKSARRAVVNGALVAEGATIAGARLIEILPDKVRFSFEGRTIDVTNSTPFP
ncbi:general secretion pathway protein GspB [Geobacter sp. DSM 9736]|uniref:general secretion pathway protein GspB n=1 Tax=Geobacter sp. DSM 9736 TaxID=1277350 RepID=UPI000B50DF63|nr:general secretion pathway protein GspB [Geobacter sp. DSM 9736]SNB45713.1 general secretion pathway protein B [Geobacter sp. DSM 9736]